MHYELLPKGTVIEEKVNSHDYWKLKEADRILVDSEKKYKENKKKKWFIAVLGMIISGVLGYYIPVVVFSLSGSYYDRTALDFAINKMFGSAKLTSALTDEVMIVAYSFDMQ